MVQLEDFIIGCEQLGGTDWGNFDHQEVALSLKLLFQNNFTCFDTADIYGLGKSESRLSRLLDTDRRSASIITKVGIRWEKGSGSRANTYKDSRPSYIRSAIEKSRSRLDLDTIPVCLIHWPDQHTKIIDTLKCLENLKNEKKIKEFGLSNFCPRVVEHLKNDFDISFYQGPLNFINLREVEPKYKSLHDKGVHIMTYGPLAHGFFSGKYKQGHIFETNDRRHRIHEFSKDNFTKYYVLNGFLNQIGRSLGISQSQVVLATLKSYLPWLSIIVGVKNSKQAKELINIRDFEIPKTLVDEIVKHI